MSALAGWLRAEVARAPTLYAALLVVAVSFAAYANSLQNGFHYDDTHHVVDNPFVRDLGRVPRYFSDPDLFSALPRHRMYRPVVMTSYALNYSWGGYRPLPWRLTALALHAFCAVGVLLAVRLLVRRLEPASGPGSAEGLRPPGTPATAAGLVAALFFALHPVFSETVNYTSARSSLLATGFVLWALFLHLRAEEAPRAWQRVAGWLLSLGCYLLALGSKEIAVVYPALLLAVALLRRRGALAVLPAALLTLGYLAVRGILLGAPVLDLAAHEAAVRHADPDTGAGRPILWNLYTQARVLVAYVSLFLLPSRLSVDRSVRVSQTPWEAGVLLGAALAAAMLVCAWRLRRRRPVTSLGLVWFLVSLAPTSSIIPLNVVMNEHRLYLPGVGLALCGADLVRAAGIRIRPPGRLVAVFAALVLAALTVRRNLDWRDSHRLWSAAVRVSPDAPRAWNSLGVERRRRGDFAGALRAFRRCLELQPRSWNAAFNMGTIHLARGRERGDRRLLAEGQAWLERSLAIRPDATRSRWYLAEALWALGRPDEARAAFERLAGESARMFEMARYPLARMALDAGRLETAEALYREARAGGHDPVAAELGLARVALRRGDEAEARRRARTAAELRPHAPEPHLFL
ncbi:MAG: tetratricopeptide repeat protein, partial [Planctomycetota bacterium]